MEDVLYIHKCLFISHNQFDKIIHEFDCQIATFQILHKVVVKMFNEQLNCKNFMDTILRILKYLMKLIKNLYI